MGFYPKGDIKLGSAEGVVLRPDPEGKRETVDREWTTSRRNGWWIFRETMENGKGKGKDCRCVTCDEIIDCMEKRGDYWGGMKRWSLLDFDCRNFVLAATNGCCLKIDGYWTR